MLKQYLGIFFVCLVASLASAPAAASPSDVWIRAELRSRFLRPSTGLTRVQIEVANRHVTLSGTVAKPELISEAEQRALEIPAIAGVSNNIQLAATGNSRALAPFSQDASKAQQAAASFWGSTFLFGCLAIVLIVALLFFLMHKKNKDDLENLQNYSGAVEKIYYSMAGFMRSQDRREREREN